MNPALKAALAAQGKEQKKIAGSTTIKKLVTTGAQSTEPIKKKKKKKKAPADAGPLPFKSLTKQVEEKTKAASVVNARAAGLKASSKETDGADIRAAQVETKKPTAEVIKNPLAETKQRGNKGNRIDLDAVKVRDGTFNPEDAEKKTRISKWDKYVSHFNEPGKALFFDPDEVSIATLQGVIKRYGEAHNIPLASCRQGKENVLYRTKEATSKAAGRVLSGGKNGEEEEE